MTENEGERRAVVDRVRPGHEMLLGLLGVYVIFFLVFWYLLVAAPFGTRLSRGVMYAATTSASVGVSPRHDVVGNQATLVPLTTMTQPSSDATVVSLWNHSASRSGP